MLGGDLLPSQGAGPESGDPGDRGQPLSGEQLSRWHCRRIGRQTEAAAQDVERTAGARRIIDLRTVGPPDPSGHPTVPVDGAGDPDPLPLGLGDRQGQVQGSGPSRSSQGDGGASMRRHEPEEMVQVGVGDQLVVLDRPHHLDPFGAVLPPGTVIEGHDQLLQRRHSASSYLLYAGTRPAVSREEEEQDRESGARATS